MDSSLASKIEQMAVEFHKKAVEKPPEIRGLEYMQMVSNMVLKAAGVNVDEKKNDG
ncbi:MAG: hypothetical protein WC455_26385 [Dehalococcoidia bacterium]|jgi:hypothetical protein